MRETDDEKSRYGLFPNSEDCILVVVVVTIVLPCCLWKFGQTLDDEKISTLDDDGNPGRQPWTTTLDDEEM